MTNDNETASDSSHSTTPSELYDRLYAEISRVLVGNEETVRHLTVSTLTGGHVLLVGNPGVAKTTIAKLFATAIGLSYRRIQMTPDILPADITGTHIYRQNTGEFELQRGPIFSNLLVADELNRATPKTQSALLEAMQEQQVTIEGETLQLPGPFLVIATLNPIENEGVFDLPVAQRDRFQLQLTVERPERADAHELLDRIDEKPDLADPTATQVTSADEIAEAQEIVWDVYVAEEIIDYILDLVEGTHSHPDVRHGASPRASIAFLNASKASAAIDGRDYVIPDDVKALTEFVLAHRLVLNTDAELSDVTAADVIADVIDATDPVSVSPEQR
ncbi:AAA family ATPase [Natronorubrum halophilum]|uniref:AAA family ATPase n=1 Tax=Natronorubrum halophilum TaxID=1702106 RepID=UPI000EF6A5CD|nr:MoxR family ATPase [Natronorubrum halophilum]